LGAIETAKFVLSIEMGKDKEGGLYFAGNIFCFKRTPPNHVKKKRRNLFHKGIMKLE